jgi:gamma-glutamyltranspeptidase/glutathione hydrolase
MSNKFTDRLPDTEAIEPVDDHLPIPQRVAISQHGMVSSQHYLATQAGVEMLTEGGNAIDAAVATALALGVCEPAASGLGGQTMMLIHLGRTHRTFAVDGSSRAPHRATPGSLDRTDRRRGHRATTVPTTPRVLDYVLARYGTLPWERVLEPAIRLAGDGYPVTSLQRRLTRRERRYLRDGSAAEFFLRGGRKSYRVGDTFTQPVLAKTLQRLARRGVDDFYSGRIADRIERDMIKHGGLIRRDDLAQVHGPIERRPVGCWFDDKRVMTFPPPGAGRTLVEMLNIISHLPKKYRQPNTPKSALLFARIMQQAYLDRHDRPFDPNFYPQVSDRKMLSGDYARRVARRITGHGETTHLSVMDRQGNAVALTQSIERVYGAAAATPGLGFLYNNYMMAFEHEDISHPYYLRPGAVPWASVAPTIILRDRKPWLVIGSPGSERITSTVFQVLMRLDKQPPLEAIDAPRLHCDINGKVSLEASRMRDDIPGYLESHGFTTDAREPYSFYLGCVSLVMRNGNQFVGVADPRRDGAAGGPEK